MLAFAEVYKRFSSVVVSWNLELNGICPLTQNLLKSEQGFIIGSAYFFLFEAESMNVHLHFLPTNEGYSDKPHI
jgi:hypothetical protein